MHVEECCQALLWNILPVIDREREGICIDVGVGTFAFYCELFARLGLKTIAVEPLPVDVVRELCNNYSITLIEACLSDVNGSQTLHIGTYQGALNLNLCSLEADWWGSSTETRQVPSVTLEKLLSGVEEQKITCIKIDVEGAEHRIIKQIEALPESLMPSVIMFEYGGGDSKEGKQKGWSAKYAKATIECLRVLKRCGYDFSIVIDATEKAREISLYLQRLDIDLDIIFPEGAIYGNIISFRGFALSEAEIAQICAAYRQDSLTIAKDSKKSEESNKDRVKSQKIRNKQQEKEANRNENGENEIIEALIETGDVVFDVGANIGIWTQYVLDRGREVKIHLFEPVPQIYQRLLQNLAESIGRGEIIANHSALSNREGIEEINFYEEFGEWSTFYRRIEVEKQYGMREPKKCPVLVTTLDRYCDRLNISIIKLLKIDTEGSELDVLLGAKELLSKGKIDYLQFEYGGTYLDAGISLKQVFEYLEGFGYTIFKIMPNRLEYIPQYQEEYENFEYGNFLAANERFRGSILGEPPKMLDLQYLCQQHSVKPRGVIHVGAHEGKEIEKYQAMGIEKVLLIEANLLVFERLKENIAGIPRIQAVNCAISDRNGTVALHITSLDQSSSILQPKEVTAIYPNIKETGEVIVQSKTLDTLLQDLQLSPSDFNLLNIDIQGAELLALQGATNLLAFVDAINTEVNYKELYEGCALIDQIDSFLESHGFQRVSTTTPYHPSWGDAFYVRQPVITMSTLGRNGRFANQIFQYAFLKIYAKEHNLRVETPSWIGQYLFGCQDPVISRQLPVVQEPTNDLASAVIANTEKVFKNVDFWGYFQYRTKYYEPHKEFFRSLFNAIPEVETKMAAALARLRSKGKTVVGLHLRRGDYGYKCFFIAPSEWYKEWLEGLWETLEEPVLFIASDEPEKTIGDFAEYNPITAKDLDIELPQADFYPDFYLLSQCDIVAISNSSFSFAACMLNERGKFFFRPHLKAKKLIPFDPWNSNPILEDAEVAEAGTTNPVESEKVEIAPSSLSVIEEAIARLNLRKINLAIFPDWNEPEERLSLELAKVMRAILNHPDKGQMTLLIGTDNCSEEDAGLFISGVVMNLLMEEELDVTEEPEISLLGQLSESQWSALAARLQYRIRLEIDSKVITNVNLRSCQPEELAGLRF